MNPTILVIPVLMITVIFFSINKENPTKQPLDEYSETIIKSQPSTIVMRKVLHSALRWPMYKAECKKNETFISGGGKCIGNNASISSSYPIINGYIVQCEGPYASDYSNKVEVILHCKENNT